VSTSPIGHTATVEADRAPFFLVLEKLGRRVLRPGGRVATGRLLEALAVSHDDDVVELAAGVGATARRLLALAPRSYAAVEPEERFAARLEAMIVPLGGRHITARAQDTGLPDASADVVMGEAMLTMQPSARRAQIVAEAARILRPGGRYGIHELAATTDDPACLAELRHDLSRATQVSASPPPATEWRELLTAAGLEIRVVDTLPLRLLTIRGVLADEGVWRSLVILARLASWPDAWRRVGRTWAMHRRHRRTLGAIVVVAQKPGTPRLVSEPVT